MTARGTPISIPTIEMYFWPWRCDDTELESLVVPGLESIVVSGLESIVVQICDAMKLVDMVVEVCDENELEGKVIDLCDETELEGRAVEICDETELEGTMVELCHNIEPEDTVVKLRDVICDIVAVEKRMGFSTEINVGVPGDDNETRTVLEIMTVFDCGSVVGSPDESIVAKGNGCSEAHKLLRQQSAPPGVCPAAPAQHQRLPLSSQRDTSV